MKRRKIDKKSFFVIIFLFLLIVLCILKNISFKEVNIVTVYDYYNNRNRTLEFDVPMLSFLYKKDLDGNYIYLWNIRENKVLEKDFSKIFNNFDEISCNGNKYYYDKKNKITIIDYKINNYYFWNTFYFKYEFDNYCDRLEIEKADKIIDYGATYSAKINDDDGNYYSIYLVLKSDFKASFVVKKVNSLRNESLEYENSRGTFTLNDNKLLYTRDRESKGIPITSEFILKDKHTLMFDEVYLRNIIDSSIVLESDSE